MPTSLQPSRTWARQLQSLLDAAIGGLRELHPALPHSNPLPPPTAWPGSSTLIRETALVDALLGKIIRQRRQGLVNGLHDADAARVLIQAQHGQRLSLQWLGQLSVTPGEFAGRINVLVPTLFGSLVFTLDELRLEGERTLVARRPGSILCLRRRGTLPCRSLTAPGPDCELVLPHLPAGHHIVRVDRIDPHGIGLLMQLGLNPHPALFAQGWLRLGEIAIELPGIRPLLMLPRPNGMWRVDLVLGRLRSDDAQQLQAWLQEARPASGEPVRVLP